MVSQDPDAFGDSKAIAQVAGDVYRDVAQPSARRVGTALETLFKIGLSPISLLDAGYEKSRAWLERKVEERIRHTPPECLTPPRSNIAIPALSRIASSEDIPELRELYAELLLKAMDKRYADRVHPAFISLLDGMSPEEAYIYISFRDWLRMPYEVRDHQVLEPHPWAGRSLYVSTLEDRFRLYCDDLKLSSVQHRLWLQNFLRLGLLEIGHYRQAKTEDEELFLFDEGAFPGVPAEDARYLSLTAFGRSFIEACAPTAQASDA